MGAGAHDWGNPTVVEDFKWEDPDLIVLNEKGKESARYRIGAGEKYRGWRGGTIWIAE